MVGCVNYVQLLGRAQLRVSSKWHQFLPDKRYQLLAYLTYMETWVRRDKLACLFWPETGQKMARHNLRQLLCRVRDLNLTPKIEADRQRLRWRVRSDVRTFLEAASSANHELALLCYRGPFGWGLESYEGSEFTTWLETERRQLHDRWREVLLRRVDELSAAADFKGATALLQILLSRDRLDEDALQLYLQIALGAGKRSQALKAYHTFTQFLDAELGLEPTILTQRLVRTLRQDTSP